MHRRPKHPQVDVNEADAVVVVNSQESVQEVQQVAEEDEEEDDDVILIPQVIETVDLCNLSFDVPRPFRYPVRNNEVIEIQDSPHSQENVTGVKPEKQQKPIGKRLNLDESHDGSHVVGITCPICLESVVKRNPVSTVCGHLYCKECLEAALQIVKKCPMCKRSLGARTSYHSIFLAG